MSNVQTNIADVDIYSANTYFSGYGHYRIEIEVVYKRQHKTFKHTTTNMEAIDNAKEAGLESWEDKVKILYDTAEDHIIEQIEEWKQQIDYQTTMIESTTQET